MQLKIVGSNPAYPPNYILALEEQMEEKRKRGRPKKSEKEMILDYINSEEEPGYEFDELVPSGLSLFDIYVSKQYQGAYPPGSIISIAGKYHSGKTMLVFTGLAECANQERFDDYKLIHINTESKPKFDFNKLFGDKFLKRVKRIDIEYPQLLENVINIINNELDSDKRSIIVVDSFDPLKVKEDLEIRKKRLEGEKGGSYNSDRTKFFKKELGPLQSNLTEKKSNIIFTSQIYSNFSQYGSQYSIAGGNAFSHYSDLIAWVMREKKIKNAKYDKQIGIKSKCIIEKNSISDNGCGEYKGILPIYYDYGIDDIASMCEWMVNEKFWNVSNQKQGHIPEFDQTMFLGGSTAKRKGIIEFIDENNLKDELKKVIQKKWLGIKEEMKPDRKPRFE